MIIATKRKTTTQTDAALDEFAKVAGMSSTEFQAAFKQAPAEAIATFVEGLGRINAEGGDVFQTLSNLGQTDIRVSQALLGMANSGDLLRNSLQLGSAAWEENSALADEAAKRYETTEAKITVAGNAVRDVAIEFGEVFLPAISDAADAVAGFSGFLSDLPDPVQGVIAALTGTVGVMALVGGGALALAPKIVEVRIALEALNITGASSKAALQSMWQFLTGPYGIAMVAATAAVVGLSVAQEKLRTSTEVFQNVLKNAKSSAELFEAGDSAVPFLSRLDEAVSSAEKFRENLDIIAHNDFLRGLRGETSQLSAVLTTMGEEMAKLAETDAPAAARSFRMLSEEMGLSKSEQVDLLNAMKPYRDELVKLADAQGRDVTTKDGQIDMTELLAFATEEGAKVTQTAAEAYMAESDAVGALNDEFSALIATIDEANGKNRDAVTANIDYQNTLRDVDEQIRNINDGVEGFGRGLDITTAAGAANKEMLVRLSQDASDAAAAQLELDGDAAAFTETLEAQRQKLYEAAIQMGASEEEAANLRDTLLRMPDDRTIRVLLQTADANARLDSLLGRLNEAVRTHFNIPVSTVGVGTVLKPPGQATGGPVVGRGPKGVDSELRMLAPGEHVITAAEVDAAGGHAGIEAYRASLRTGSWQAPGDRIGYQQVPMPTEQRPIQITENIYALPGMNESHLARKSAAAINEALRG
ncbi:phage tail tape measure protein [Microbacterium sp. NPDC078814]|uniref:phage tail tape measure protein n=1 Tax=Microbacterium sp. NPDC078814 TaxID=3154767 RepID=UPI00344FC045